MLRRLALLYSMCRMHARDCVRSHRVCIVTPFLHASGLRVTTDFKNQGMIHTNSVCIVEQLPEEIHVMLRFFTGRKYFPSRDQKVPYYNERNTFFYAPVFM
jgi:hypothetical protein